MAQKVLVTGVSGYLGAWCANKALEAGYEVIGTVRDPESKKCSFLRDAMAGKPDTKMCAAAATALTLVKADLLSGEEYWDKEVFAGRGIDFVLHTASPYFTKAPKNEDDYIRPAVDGTNAVLKAAVKHGAKRVVVTSSGAAIWDPMVEGKVYSAEDWSDASLQSAYGKSKTLAERAAWDAVKGTSVGLSTVLPMFVLGPTLYDDKDMLRGFESGHLCIKIMRGKMSNVPRVSMGISDVRDVASAHVLALSNPDAPGKRFIVSSGTKWFADILAIFAKARPELRLSARTIPTPLLNVVALFNASVASMKSRLGVKYDVDAGPATRVLGLHFTDEVETVREMMDDFVRFGVLSGTPEPKGACRCAKRAKKA
eukprot:NODE_8543_length_1488_cov_5.001470.p1 GENE.NODE_8543_length_1488_cov_5.001470~~NODE_8543_length_1488_cov_5.001470.p1  ORF type:complete len:407 (+),score=79.88 NODE_8543_length_1488_cov_5.001470:117-1223(+)